jgi:hypothetical protein
MTAWLSLHGAQVVAEGGHDCVVEDKIVSFD